MQYELVIRDKTTNETLYSFQEIGAFLNPLHLIGSQTPFKPKSEKDALNLIVRLLTGVYVPFGDMVLELKPPKPHIGIEIKGGLLDKIVTNSDNVFFSWIDWDSLLEQGEKNEFTDYDDWVVLSPRDFKRYLNDPTEE